MVMVLVLLLLVGKLYDILRPLDDWRMLLLLLIILRERMCKDLAIPDALCLASSVILPVHELL